MPECYVNLALYISKSGKFANLHWSKIKLTHANSFMAACRGRLKGIRTICTVPMPQALLNIRNGLY